MPLGAHPEIPGVSSQHRGFAVSLAQSVLLVHRRKVAVPPQVVGGEEVQEGVHVVVKDCVLQLPLTPWLNVKVAQQRRFPHSDGVRHAMTSSLGQARSQAIAPASAS